MKSHLYLRASTKDQDALRAKASLEAFVAEKGLLVAGVYSENISGTTLDRPELMRMLDEAQTGECIVCESVDRLSRLSQSDWETLKAKIKAKGLRLVIADLPTSHMLIEDKGMTGQIMDVINSMLLDLMATMARLDQEKRVERIRQGLENKRLADPSWTPKGKGRNVEKWTKVQMLIEKHPNMSANDIAKLADVGVATVYRIKRGA
ncbi:recombinase family protein [Pseudomonas fulva]|uniref:recombinase family protein n=1 Tax=Pseudomonas fulva TaxID=47880 RepID=UPI000F7AD3A0|nr:recombinase family protein [Pseudomonas fulva]MBA1207476.1 recombinase family protein [Pseudomonas fulva]MBA1216889.1 recombinase family protein [Pseudomonas fulva]MDH0571557.1 recombinase family protein [Pseudomonas fulva]RRW63722.1 resolvase [Pseudomonas fulva]